MDIRFNYICIYLSWDIHNHSRKWFKSKKKENPTILFFLFTIKSKKNFYRIQGIGL